MKGVIKLSKADISSITDSEERFEIIDGVKIYMLAAASFNHNFFAARLVSIFNSYFLKHGKGVAVHDVDVPLPDGNLFRPDVCVITDLAWLESDENSSVVPALVVEILSRSTMKNDLGIKKNIYERNGVKEYWIVDQWSKRVDVYHLVDGRYELDDVYRLFSDRELAAMNEADRTEVKYAIKVSLFDGLIVDIRDVFNFWWKKKSEE